MHDRSGDEDVHVRAAEALTSLPANWMPCVVVALHYTSEDGTVFFHIATGVSRAGAVVN
jgi:hypothetical protein